jgi:hypothetical protein
MLAADLISQPWKQIERRGICHYPDISSETIYIVSVDDFETIQQFVRGRHPFWTEHGEYYRDKTWFLVVFDELHPWNLRAMSSPPFATLEEAIRFAEQKIPTGIIWKGAQDET